MNLSDLRDLLYGRRITPLVVGVIFEERISAAIGARTHEVLLSKDTVLKQHKRHPDLGPEHYAMLPFIIRHGLVIHEKENPRHAAICYEPVPLTPGGRFMVALKSPADGKSIYVTSLHRTRPRQTNSLLKRGNILRNHH
jgi:hypothetical protein